jgi:hypothetical protein
MTISKGQFNKAARAAEHMELRIGVQEGLLDPKTHRIMKLVVSYVSAIYSMQPGLMDLEGAIFDDVDEMLCRKIVNDVKKRFQRQLRFLEIYCL